MDNNCHLGALATISKSLWDFLGVFSLISFFTPHFLKEKTDNSRLKDSRESPQYIPTIQISSCASVFARNPAPEAGHNCASTSGEGCAEQGQAVPLHTCLPGLHRIRLHAPELSLLSTREHMERFQISPWRACGPIMSHCHTVSWFSAVSMLALSHFCHFLSQLSSAEPQWPLVMTSSGSGPLSSELSTSASTWSSQELSMRVAYRRNLFMRTWELLSLKDNKRNYYNQ